MERSVERPHHNVKANIEVRNRVPQGSASQAGLVEIGRAANATYGDTGGRARTYRRRRRTIVLHTIHATIDRRSPLRIPSMFIGSVERPYGGEFYIVAGGEYTLLQPPNS